MIAPIEQLSSISSLGLGHDVKAENENQTILRLFSKLRLIR